MEGKKMSKSFGNIIPIRDGVETYSADGLRLAILATSGLLQDADFSPTLARSIRERLERLYTQSLELLAETPEHAAAEHGLWEKWLLSRLQAVIKGATDALESLRVRDAVQHVFYNLDQDIQWYMKQATAAKTLQEKLLAQRVLRHVFKTRLQLLAPFTPFICEELWSMFGEKGFISQSRWPQHDPALVNPEVEESVTLLKALIEDTQNIIKATGITPATIRFYTCAEWKRKVYRMALELAAGNRLDQGSLMKTATADPEIRSRGKDAARFIQTLYKNVSTMPSDLQQRHLTLTIDEYTTVKTAASLLQTEFKAQVEVYREEDERRVDPKNRASLAAPYRPAIHIE